MDISANLERIGKLFEHIFTLWSNNELDVFVVSSQNWCAKNPFLLFHLDSYYSFPSYAHLES